MRIPRRLDHGLYPTLRLALGLALVSAAGCPHAPAGPEPSTGAPRRAGPPPRRAGPDAAQLRRAMETICDRMEDCAVERNVSLARAYGGTRADVDAAREQARRALHSGYVRRWCQLRLGNLEVPKVMGIHRCLSKTACDPFFRCAALPDRAPRIR